MACGRWRHVFATSANPRSRKKKWPCYPLLLFAWGKMLNQMFNIRIESMVQAAFVVGRISVGSYQPRDRNMRTQTIDRTDLPLRPNVTGN